LADEVPGRCDFAVTGHAFQISTREIQKNLRQIAKQADIAERNAELKSLQGSLQRSLAGMDAYTRAVDPTAKPKLEEILQRQEFRRVGQQDPSAILREWAYQLLSRILSRMLKDPSRIEFAAKIVVWSICLLVAAFIIWNLYRWAMRQGSVEAVREAIPFAPSSKDWRDWLGEAQAAVGQGELREAVHAGYWAAISHLESSGTWRPDRARTPREYLRLIAQTHPSRPLLADITRDFEVIWYGNRRPALTEWNSFLAKVEQIGCR
jgi:hypothetical protein